MVQTGRKKEKSPVKKRLEYHIRSRKLLNVECMGGEQDGEQSSRTLNRFHNIILNRVN